MRKLIIVLALLVLPFSSARAQLNITNSTTVGWTNTTENLTAEVLPGANGWQDLGDDVALGTAADNVGVGTTAPQQKLHVQDGNLLISGDQKELQLKHNSTDYDLHPTDAGLFIEIEDIPYIFIQNGTGRVGIGTSDPQYPVHVEGVIYATSIVMPGSDEGEINATKNITMNPGVGYHVITNQGLKAADRDHGFTIIDLNATGIYKLPPTTNAFTISKLSVLVTGGNNVTGMMMECNGTGGSCANINATRVFEADTEVEISSLTDSAIAADVYLAWNTTAINGPCNVTVGYALDEN